MPDKENWRESIEIDLAAIEAQIEEIERAVGRRPLPARDVADPAPATESAAANPPTPTAAERPDATPAAADAISAHATEQRAVDAPFVRERTPTAAPPSPPTAAPATAPAAARESSRLLDELREAARERSQREIADDSERKAREARLNKRMRGLFQYLTEFCRHLDTIKLPVPATYWLNAQTPLTGLHWKDSFVDSRLASLSDTAPLVLVQVRYSLAADGVIVIGRDIAHSGVFQNELTAMDMNYTVRDQRSAAGKLVAQDFLIEREVRVTLSAVPDYETGTVALRARNFTDFGVVDYTCHSELLDEEFFEELGRQILGRPSRLLQLLKADVRLRT